jgi:tubulin-folding cofactor B
MNNHDLIALQQYVTAKDASQYNDLHPDTLILDLTHSNLIQRHIEIRFDKHTTISSLRDKIYQKTGTPPHYQHLQFFNSKHSPPTYDIPPEIDSSRMLGYYSLCHGMTCHCIDLDPNSGSKGGGYEDISQVKRYVMSDEDYDKRKGTLRDWSRKQKEKDESFSLAKHAKLHRELMEAQRQAKLGHDLPSGFEYDSQGKVVRVEEEDTQKAEKNRKSAPEEYGISTVAGIQVGLRCEVQPGNRRGAVAYVGEIPELGVGGHWVGIVFDEPVGKTDGSINGRKYFETPGSMYGGFARGKNVQVGDFPERDIMDELEDSSEDEL